MDVINSNNVTTRKEHSCVGCCGTIPKGRTVRRQTIVDCGEIYSSYMCEICEDVISRWDVLDDFFEGDIINNDPEAWASAAMKFEERTGESHNRAIVTLKRHAEDRL